MRKTLSIIAPAVLVATSAAAAERTGFYIGGDLGQSSWDVFSKSDARDLIYAFEDIGGLYPNAIGVDVISSKTNLEDTDFTYSLFVGYQFLPWLAAEGLGWTSARRASRPRVTTSIFTTPSMTLTRPSTTTADRLGPGLGGRRTTRLRRRILLGQR